MSIRARVTLVGVGIVTLVICCLSASLYALIANGLGADRDKQLAARADEAVAELAAAARDDFEPGRVLAPVDPRSSMDVFVIVLDGAGAVLSSTGAVDGAVPAVPASARADADRVGQAAVSVPLAGGAPGETLRMQVRPWARSDLGLRGYVVAAQTSRRVEQDRAGLLALFVISGLVTFVAAAIAVWVAAGRALRPLRQMAVMADEVGRSHDLGRRLPAVATRDAVGRLTTSFNAMMDRLQEAYARVANALVAQQRFTADASHELRTPLTTIRNNAEFLLQHPDAREEDRAAALRDIAGESVRLSRLIENLLILARADGGVQLRRQPVNLAEVAEAVCRQASGVHPDRQFQFAGTPARPVLGDEDVLRQLVWILLDNAVKFTMDGGRVWVAVTQRGGTVQLTVADNGVGIPAGAERHIFDRFYRADPARSGTGAGLGLAIAAWIVREHGGHIVAGTNDQGGATFSVDLPGAPLPNDPTMDLSPPAIEPPGPAEAPRAPAAIRP
jgi:signal transduction histidine kinase